MQAILLGSPPPKKKPSIGSLAPSFSLRCKITVCRSIAFLIIVPNSAYYGFDICSYKSTLFILNFFSLCFDRTYASKYIPIIASVSEHQPPTWPSYFMDINVLAFLVPAGIIVSCDFSIQVCFIYTYTSNMVCLLW